MKLPKNTKADPEFAKQKRREMILDSFRLGFGFQVRDADREEKIEKIILSEYGDDLERAQHDYDYNVMRFEFASNVATEQHGTLVIGEKRFAI